MSLDYDKSGRIIISSVVGKVSTPMISRYAANKHAIEAYSDALRMEVKGFHAISFAFTPVAKRLSFAMKNSTFSMKIKS